MMMAGNTKIVNIMMREARGAPIAFLKDIINPNKGHLMKGIRVDFDSLFYSASPEYPVPLSAGLQG
jgi:hypothetical protein